jgi:hypothetical protein
MPHVKEETMRDAMADAFHSLLEVMDCCKTPEEWEICCHENPVCCPVC